MHYIPNDPMTVDLVRYMRMDLEFADRQGSARRGRSATVIPAANRYPRSISRANAEAELQPWNRDRLGADSTNGYRANV